MENTRNSRNKVIRKHVGLLSIAAIAGLSLVLLSGCGKHQQLPLHGIYYGYYQPKNPNQFFVLAFDKDHHDHVAVRRNDGALKVDSVYNVTYGKHSIKVHTGQNTITLLVSDHGNTLTCTDCAAVNSPKTYLYAHDKGKPYPANIGDIAYKTISKNAKADGKYLPKH